MFHSNSQFEKWVYKNILFKILATKISEWSKQLNENFQAKFNNKNEEGSGDGRVEGGRQKVFFNSVNP